MSSYSDSRPAQKRPRFTLQATFPSNEERDTFSRRFEAICKILQPVALDNHGLLCATFDTVERSTRQDTFPGDARVETKSFLRNSGKIECTRAKHLQM